MKRFFFIFAIFIGFIAVASAQENSETDVIKFRELRDKQFRNRAVSPLRQADFLTFENLNYFTIKKEFIVKGILEKTPDDKAFMMPTSTGVSRKYRRIGILKFSLAGAEFSLGAYQREYEPNAAQPKRIDMDLFVPFKDLTNGTETYGAGRYVYLRVSEETNEAILDFNLAFNPSCAYGDEGFSCPIPPKENFLQAEIKAGEKIYKNYGAKQE